MGSKKNARSAGCRHRAPVIALDEYRRCGVRREPRGAGPGAGPGSDPGSDPGSEDVKPDPVVEAPDTDPADDEGGIILCW